MTKLTQTAIVETPFAHAADLVEQFLKEAANDEGVITIELQAPGAGVGLAGVALQRDVAVTFRRRKGPNQTIVFALHWEACDPGPYPVFDGTLTVAEDETYSTCRLILEGSYDAPFGFAGAIFDAAIGSRIAEATCKQLLERMRGYLNAGYEQSEREKELRRLLARSA